MHLYNRCFLFSIFEGIEVNYSIPVCGKEAGNATIRHLIVCWTGDHSGQCEIGKLIKCGRCACRRCKAQSESKKG